MLSAKTVYLFVTPSKEEIKKICKALLSKPDVKFKVEEDLNGWEAIIRVKLSNLGTHRKKILYVYQEDSNRVRLDVSPEYSEGKGQRPGMYPKRTYFNSDIEKLKITIQTEIDRWSSD